MMNLTAYVESEAILAAQEEDWDELHRLIGLMLPDERDRLREAARDLMGALEAWPEKWGADEGGRDA